MRRRLSRPYVCAVQPPTGANRLRRPLSRALGFGTTAHREINGRFALVVVAVLGVLGASVVAAAQEAKSGKIARIGRLSPLSAEADAPGLDAFRRGLRDLGWVEGRDFAIETRFAEGKPERLPELAAQLVRQRVDLL